MLHKTNGRACYSPLRSDFGEHVEMPLLFRAPCSIKSCAAVSVKHSFLLHSGSDGQAGSRIGGASQVEIRWIEYFFPLDELVDRRVEFL
jgi:hypothetical protein